VVLKNAFRVWSSLEFNLSKSLISYGHAAGSSLILLRYGLYFKSAQLNPL